MGRAKRLSPENAARHAISNKEIAPKSLNVQSMGPKGRGVVASRKFTKGDFITFYNGVFVENEERLKENDTYVFEVRSGTKRIWIDGSQEDGSYGRLINDDHRYPTVRPKQLLIEGFPWIVFFAIRDINPGDEITYSYGGSAYWWRNKEENKKIVGHEIETSPKSPSLRLDDDVEHEELVVNQKETSPSKPHSLRMDNVEENKEQVANEVGLSPFKPPSLRLDDDEENVTADANDVEISPSKCLSLRLDDDQATDKSDSNEETEEQVANEVGSLPSKTPSLRLDDDAETEELVSYEIRITPSKPPSLRLDDDEENENLVAHEVLNSPSKPPSLRLDGGQDNEEVVAHEVRNVPYMSPSLRLDDNEENEELVPNEKGTSPLKPTSHRLHNDQANEILDKLDANEELVLNAETGLFVKQPRQRTAVTVSILDCDTGEFRLVPKSEEDTFLSKEEASDSDDYSAQSVIPSNAKSIPANSERKNTKKSPKRLACLFCKRLFVHQIGEHLENCHSNETIVAKALAMKAKSLDRKRAFQRILYKGNFEHNIAILNGTKEGELIVVRKSRKHEHTNEDYLPCPVCLGFFRKPELYKHYRQCPHKNPSIPQDQKQVGLIAQAQLIVDAAVLPFSSRSEDEFELHPVLSKMQKDELFNDFLVNDHLILRFGRVLKDKLGLRRKNDIAQRMRQLARIKKQLGLPSIDDAIKGSTFDNVVNATLALCIASLSDDDITIFQKPGLALTMGHNLKKIANIKFGLRLRNDDEKGQKEAETFLTLFKQEWTDRISSIALASLATQKFEKSSLLPCTENMTKLANYCDTEMSRLTLQLEQNKRNQEIWRSLCEVTMVKILLFNKRRGGEAQSIRVCSYTDRKNYVSAANKEIQSTFTPLEKQLFERLEMVETIGKQNKTVPTLLTKHMVKALDTMTETRDSCGIKAENKYLFASKGLGSIKTWPTLRSVAVDAGCNQPELISATKMRKYIATVVQVMDLEANELGWLANHLSHDLSTHKNFYRKHEASIELAKISKLLLAAEYGKISQFQGKSLKDLNLEDIPFTDDCTDAVEDDGDMDYIDEELAGLDDNIGQTRDASKLRDDSPSHGGEKSKGQNHKVRKIKADSANHCRKTSKRPRIAVVSDDDRSDEYMDIKRHTRQNRETSKRRDDSTRQCGKMSKRLNRDASIIRDEPMTHSCKKSKRSSIAAISDDETMDTNRPTRQDDKSDESIGSEKPKRQDNKTDKSIRSEKPKRQDDKNYEKIGSEKPKRQDDKTDESIGSEKPKRFHKKKTWSADENRILGRIFKVQIKNKIMPPGVKIHAATAHLKTEQLLRYEQN